MPYEIKKGRGKRPYKIVRKADGKVVGTSATAAKAYGSIKQRMSGESGKSKSRAYESVHDPLYVPRQ